MQREPIGDSKLRHGETVWHSGSGLGMVVGSGAQWRTSLVVAPMDPKENAFVAKREEIFYPSPRDMAFTPSPVVTDAKISETANIKGLT